MSHVEDGTEEETKDHDRDMDEGEVAQGLETLKQGHMGNGYEATTD